MNTPRCLTALLGLMLGTLLAGPAPADDLGRLFTSAAERARIDTARAGTQSTQNDTANVSGGERVVINGTLRGSDGKRLVWVNGAPVNPQAARDLRLLRDGRVQLSWRDGVKILQPGQGIDPATGAIFEHHTPAPAPAPKPATDTAVVADIKAESPAAAAAPAVNSAESPTTDAVRPKVN